MKKYLLVIIFFMCKSHVGFTQKSNLDSLVKLSPKLPTVLEFREDNLAEKLKRPVKTFPPNGKIRICSPSRHSLEKPPLFILDGMELANADSLKIEPKNIESIEVLKNKSAFEIYGKKAENGVIIITSKKK